MIFYGKAGASGRPAALMSTPLHQQLVTMPGAQQPSSPPGSPAISSPHRTGGHRSAAAVPPAESMLSTSHQLRVAIEHEEAEQRHHIFAEYLYEEKVVRMDHKLARRAEHEAAQRTRQVHRAVNLLLKETEPDARASIRIAEEKCCAALVHLLTLERATLCCSEELIRVVEMERRRRRFLISFEEREFKELSKSTASDALWRPGIHCFGPCPFVQSERDCPFRDKELYGLHIDRSHFHVCNKPSHQQQQQQAKNTAASESLILAQEDKRIDQVASLERLVRVRV